MKCGTLKNNWKYIINPSSCQKTVTILILFRAGSLYERSGERGLSHFIEHLFFQGTTGKLKKSKDITQMIYQHGGYINAYTTHDYTGYYIKIGAKYLEEALRVLSEMIFMSKFAKEALDREKKIVIQENNKHNSEPFRVLQELNYELIYAGTPLAESVGGTEKEIRKFDRKKILRYLGERYQEAVISVAGKLEGSQKKVEELLEKYLGKSMKYGSLKNSENKQIKKIFRPTYSKPRLKVLKMNFKETYVGMGFPVNALMNGITNAKERAACDILGVILAGNMNSRLFMRLREEKQYVYTVKYFINHYEIGGGLIFQCGTQSRYLKKVISEILEELIAIKGNKKIYKKEMNDAVKYRTGELILSTEDSREVAAFQAYQYMFLNQCYGIEDEIKIYQKLRLKDVQEVANKILDFQKINLGIIYNN